MHPRTKASIANAGHVAWDAHRAALAAGENPDEPDDTECAYPGYLHVLARPPGSFENNVCINPQMGDADLNSGPGSGSRPQDSVRRETGELSTLVSQPAPLPSWKQEVNNRLAAHKNRKGLSVVEQNAPAEAQSAASSRAAQAAARVAARYAKAPSYSEMQAAEARAALRAAETATRAALEAQAAAQVALANLETATNELADYEESAVSEAVLESSAQPTWEPEKPAIPVASNRQPLEIRWDPDMPVRQAAPPAAPALSEQEEFEATEEQWWGSGTLSSATASHQAIEPVEPALLISANLIEFPRELVATRRMRPRLTGATHSPSGEMDGQLSIFEVDPSTISIEPGVTDAASEPPAPSWSGPEWSRIEMDLQAAEEAQAQAEAERAAAAPNLQLAPFERRLLAAVVDAALIVGAFCGGAAAIAARMQLPSTAKAVELGAIGALVVAAALYLTLFLAFAKSTPGMWYARISLCTFDDECPTRAQRCGRLGALLLSLLPVGLGVAWVIFDEDRLSWHDRLSRTYLRNC
jgi:uncharacterized RDD family membrane protein YckC